MSKQAVAISPWSVGAIVLAVMTAACASQSPVYRGPVGAPRVEIDRPHFVSAPRSQCVPYARQRSGIDIFGDANLWWQLAADEGYGRAYQPEPGGVIVLQVGAEGERGHVAYVQRVISNREILVDHANWHGHGEVAVNVPMIDISPNNDWSEVRVFWVETQQMGVKTYPVEGFVLPAHGFGA